MFTVVAKGPLACCLLCCNDTDYDEERSGTPPPQRPLLDRSSSSSSIMPRPRTYGKRKCTGTTAASAIFGSASSPRRLPSSPVRAPLADLTSLVANLEIRVEEQNNDPALSTTTENQDPRRCQALRANEEQELNDVDGSNLSSQHASSKYSKDSDEDSLDSLPVSPDTIALRPLIEAYRADCRRELQVADWEAVLPARSHVVKIAEASYAEVYRVSIDGEDSILKLMQLKIPSDPSSLHCYTAIDVKQVVSEVRLMNALTEFPGFVTFKDAHLIQGKPCNSIIKAHDNCTRWDPATQSSEFPHPSTFTDNSLFLAIELGDAGNVLDDVPLRTISRVWDVLIGVIIALASAEHNFQFEHRDLHENNICISSGNSTAVAFSNGIQKYGLSGLRVTLLDYGLSRATLPNRDEVYYDLETDLAVFRGPSPHSQFDTYRRMRTHLFTGGRTMFPRAWHDEDSRQLNNGYTWREFRPYSNVLWIKYLFGYLKKNYKDSGGDPSDWSRFSVETSEFTKRLNFKTLVANGAFSTAGDAFEYICEKGWLTAEQIVDLAEGSSILNDSRDTEEGEDADEE